MTASRLPRLAVLGRPNVGKSTLLNRFVGRRVAIVEEKPGVTRDRREETVEWSGRRFVAVDTGGWQSRPENAIGESIRDQAERAMEGADAVLLVCDATVGVTQEDLDAARLVQRAGIPASVAVNKIDDVSAEPIAAEFYRLGLGDPHPVSALHGRRSGDLLDAVCATLPVQSSDEHEDRAKVAAVAIVGRPNVGKSTLFNRLVGDERTIVHDAPGTTRDAIDTLVNLDGTEYTFVDTAGLRRRASVDDRTEYYSRVRAIEALRRADVALLVIDAAEGPTAADQKVADEIVAAGTAAIVVLNKWDTLQGEARIDAARDVREDLAYIAWAPLLRISARSGAGVARLAPTIASVLAQHRRRVSTSAVNDVIHHAQDRHSAPTSGGRPTRIRYATQTGESPPRFALFANRQLPIEYLRYLDRRIREAFGFEGTPIRLQVKMKAGAGAGRRGR